MSRAFLVTLVGLAALLAAAAPEETEIPESITFENSRGAVTFPHLAHQERGYACKGCHHNVENDTDEPTEFCHDCHTADSEVSTRDAFHATCRDCHREFRDDGAPYACGACHVR